MRLNEQDKDESDAVHNLLSVIENVRFYFNFFYKSKLSNQKNLLKKFFLMISFLN